MKKSILAYGRLNDDQLAQLGHDFEVQAFPDLTSADDPAGRWNCSMRRPTWR